MNERARQYINKWILILKGHGLVCIFAVLIGAASFAPYWLAQHALGADYQGFPYLYQANEDYYLARIQDIVDGHWMASSPYIYEYKNILPVVFPIGEFIYALPALLFGISAVSILMVTKFIFPIFLFLLVYALLYNLSQRTRGDKIVAFLGGLLVTMGDHLISYKHTWSLLTGQSTDLYLSVWTRAVNPIIGGLFLFLFLILLWKSIRSKRWRYPAAAGIVLGLMPGYIFSWLSALAVVGAMVIFSLVRRHFKTVKRLLFVVLCGILVSAPVWYFWIQSIFVAADSQYTSSHLGLTLTHLPILNKVVLLQTIVFLTFFLLEWYKRKKHSEGLEEWWFMAALVAGNWLVYNQQIVTGRVVWPPHLTQYTNSLAFLTSVWVLGNYFKIRTPRLWIFFIIVISGLIAFYTGMATFSYRQSSIKEYVAAQSRVPFFVWLNHQAPKDCVVLVKEDSEILNNWIPALTHCNVYKSTYAMTPLDRVYFNYVISLRLRGTEEDGLEQYLWDHKADLRPYFYTTWSQIFTPTDDSWLAEPIHKIVNDYHRSLKEDFTTVLRHYRVDYLVSEEALPVSLMKQFSRLVLLGKFGSVYVYQL